MRLINYELTMADTANRNIKSPSNHQIDFKIALFITELVAKYPTLFRVYRTGLISLGYRHGCELHNQLQQPCN